MSAVSHAPIGPGAPAGFWYLVRSEATKLRTVRRWVIGLAGFVVLTVGFGMLTAAGSGSDVNEHPTFVVGPDGAAVVDDFYFVHGPLTGDAAIVTRVAAQQPSHPGARAGLMIKHGTASGSRYASIAVTPGGVLFDADFSSGTRSTSETAPRWLRLTLDGTTVSGYESGDGVDWRLVGRADLIGAERGLQIGLFVSSPPKLTVHRSAEGTSVGQQPTTGAATFDEVTVQPRSAATIGTWQGTEISSGLAKPPDPSLPSVAESDAGAGFSEADGVYSVTGSGAIGSAEAPDDGVQASLFGTVFGLMALATVSVLFITSEYKHHLIRTTFTATPRRIRAFAAKAIVLGGTAFAIGLVASVVAYLAARPVLEANGFTLPAYSPTSLGQAGVVRAIVGNAILLTAFALLGLAFGAIWRRSGGAIVLVFTLGVLPLFVSAIVPSAAKWLLWLTPAGGFAVQRAKPPTNTLAEPWSQINPWLGLGVACTYAAIAMTGASWLIARRDP